MYKCEDMEWKRTMDQDTSQLSINKQLVKEEQIKTVPLPRPFNTFNADGTRSGNHRVTQFIQLELEINGHTENIDAVVIDLKSIDMVLEYYWLVKHNLEVNWDKETIWFTKFPKKCKIQY